MINDDICAAVENLMEICQQHKISCGIFMMNPDMTSGAEAVQGSGGIVGYIIERLFTDPKYSDLAEAFYETLQEDFDDGVTFQ